MSTEPIPEITSNYAQTDTASSKNGTHWYETASANNFTNLDAFLETEKLNNANEPWSKLDKTIKILKLIVFAKKYAEENPLTPFEQDTLIVFFRDCLNRKKLLRVKDVIYDKNIGEIKEIPGLCYTSVNNSFMLKSMDKKRVSTLSNLPSHIKK